MASTVIYDQSREKKIGKRGTITLRVFEELGYLHVEKTFKDASGDVYSTETMGLTVDELRAIVAAADRKNGAL